MKKIASTPERVDAYLAVLPPDQRAALEALRAFLKRLVPDAAEVISYGIPTLRHHGALVGFAAFKNHCSFFIMSTRVAEAFADDLKDFSTAKATVHFTPTEPLPEDLVSNIVHARMAENEAGRQKA